MEKFLNYLSDNVEDVEAFVIKILITIAFIVIVLLIRRIISSLIHRFAEEESVARRFSRISGMISVGLILLGIFYMWFNSFRGIGILIGIFILILGLSLRDILLDIIYYFYVVFKEPFKLEDVIEINGYIGIVEKIDFMQVHIQELRGLLDTRTPTGRIITFPNRTLMENPLINYTRDSVFVLHDTYILIAFGEDRKKAAKLTGQYIYNFHEDLKKNYVVEEEREREFKIFNREMEYLGQTSKPDVWQKYDSKGIRIYVRFFTPVQDMGHNKRTVELGIYDLFVENNIEMPTPKYINIED